MSNIYIQEPPTSGKVLLSTTVGDIEIELWSKEAPKACRNFVQLCLEGFYDGSLFNRVVKGFIAQGGEGSQSIYGQPFKNEVHSRLRFNRRGLVATANSGQEDNGSDFFFTLGATPELQGKHTIFGKVAGDTIYNMIKLEDGDVDQDDRPYHCHKVIKTEILNNPFPDIVPRLKSQKEKKDTKKKQARKQGVKNFKLLSFGEEAEEDEEETIELNRNLSKKNKSSHDLLNDPKLSAEVALPASASSPVSKVPSDGEEENVDDDKEEKEDYYLGKARDEELLKRREQIQREIQQVKDDYKNRKKMKDALDEEANSSSTDKEKKNEMLDEYKANLVKYGKIKKELPQKGSSREKFTLQLLAKFQDKLKAVKRKVEEDGEDDGDGDKKVGDDETWMSHPLKFEEGPVLARDANTKGDDWFDITDPRNAINKRRREMTNAKKAELHNLAKTL